MKLKETNNTLTSDVRGRVSGLTKKLLHEWGELHLKDGLLYRETSQRSQLGPQDSTRILTSPEVCLSVKEGRVCLTQRVEKRDRGHMKRKE